MNIQSFSNVFGNFAQEPAEWLRAKGWQVDLQPADRRMTKEAALERAAGADALLAGLMPIDRDIIAAAPRLKVICMHGAGVDHIDLAAAVDHGVTVCNVPGGNARSVAEMALGLCFALARRIPWASRLPGQGQWPIVVTSLLHRKTLGIIGLGKIGQELAGMAGALGMKLVAATRTQRPDLAADLGVELVSLDELLGRADYVVLLAPKTPETLGLIGERELALMKPSACLLNLSRGGLVDEQALYQALKQGRLAGAALDVWAKEPIFDSPLLDLPQFIATPHMAGFAIEALREVGQAAAENIAAVLEGRRPPNPVSA